MALPHSCSASRALFRIFVQPLISQQQIIPRSTLHVPCRTLCPQSSRTCNVVSQRSQFSTSPRLTSQTRPPEKRANKQDNEITAPYVYLIDPQTNQLEKQTRSTWQVRQMYDIKTHKLVQVSTDSQAEGEEDEDDPLAVPICKIINRLEEYKQQKRRKIAGKESRRVSAVANSTKTLELNWAIDANDLGHRVDKLQGFLHEGRKVDVILAAKKRGRRASPAEIEDVLRRLREAVEGVPGAKEMKTEGTVGGFFTLFLQGKPIKSVSKQAKGSTEDNAEGKPGGNSEGGDVQEAGPVVGAAKTESTVEAAR